MIYYIFNLRRGQVGHGHILRAGQKLASHFYDLKNFCHNPLSDKVHSTRPLIRLYLLTFANNSCIVFLSCSAKMSASMLEKVNQVVIPGDVIGSLAGSSSGIRLGQGLIQNQENIVATKAGVLRHKPPDRFWVESNHKRVRIYYFMVVTLLA